TEKFERLLKPDIFASGIKDKFIPQKMGIPSKQLHSYDYSGPYAGFNGAVKFAEDITAMFTTPTWNFISPPWKGKPMLEGAMQKEAK
ncbi:nitrogenase molybdenum-iron protein alpha chain, partial [bacterium]